MMATIMPITTNTQIATCIQIHIGDMTHTLTASAGATGEDCAVRI
jgi:hypothetical protein